MTISSLSEVTKPVSLARGLPNEHYISDTVFETEKHAVLFATWSGLCVGNDIPEPGDAMPVDFVGMPLLAVRGKDGQVRVFQNTCRHRGMKLVSEKGKLRGAIRCPYHSWCYSTEGRLVATPHVGGPGHNTHADIDRSALGLFEIRSHVWHDIVFINVSGTAPEFEDYAADLIARLAEFEQPVYHGGPESSFKFEVNCNWKLAVENYCESYHLPWIHPGLNSYSRLEDHYNIENPGAFSGQGTLVYRQLTGEMDGKFTDFAGLSDKWESGAEYIAVYPNVLIGFHRDHFFSIVLQPTDPGRTVEHVDIYYADSAVRNGDRDPLRQANATLWKTVFAEDVFVVEGMQEGRRGHLFDGGKFSAVMDGPTHCFHAWVADRLLGHDLAAE